VAAPDVGIFMAVFGLGHIYLGTAKLGSLGFEGFHHHARGGSVFRVVPIGLYPDLDGDGAGGVVHGPHSLSAFGRRNRSSPQCHCSPVCMARHLFQPFYHGDWICVCPCPAWMDL